MKVSFGLASPVRARVLLILILLAVGAPVGIVYWAWQGSLIGVALSALVPGLCAIPFVYARS
jgi:hypothetical protein